jgi:hypothetical protein
LQRMGELQKRRKRIYTEEFRRLAVAEFVEGVKYVWDSTVRKGAELQRLFHWKRFRSRTLLLAPPPGRYKPARRTSIVIRRCREGSRPLNIRSGNASALPLRSWQNNVSLSSSRLLALLLFLVLNIFLRRLLPLLSVLALLAGGALIGVVLSGLVLAANILVLVAHYFLQVRLDATRTPAEVNENS